MIIWIWIGKLDIIKIYAEPFECNLASRKVLEKSNYKLEAILKDNIYKNGKIINSCIYSLYKWWLINSNFNIVLIILILYL